jgi:hypothetical protein
LTVNGGKGAAERSKGLSIFDTTNLKYKLLNYKCGRGYLG